jgi:hypothetical protein
MTVPSTNINMITHIRNGFMQDTSGNASLTSNKYRDGARKPTGNISLQDFAGKAWSQGRTIKRTMAGDTAASVRPYCWDQRWDNLSASDVTFTLSYEGGLPKWSYGHTGKSHPTASYNNSYFYCNTNDTFRIRATANLGGTGVTHDFSVIGFSDGYLSGFSMPYIEDATNFGGINFTTDDWYPYVLVSFRGYNNGGSRPPTATFYVTGAEVFKV